MNSEDKVDDHTTMVLAELGLNEYETRAYLTILEGGVVVAREVSDRAAIPYAKVYQTLNSLITKRLIVGDEGRPRKFRARHPKEAMNERLQIMEEEWQSSQRRRRKLLASIQNELVNLFESSDVDVAREQGVWNISGLTNITSRITNLVNISQNKIVVITGDHEFFEQNITHLLENSSDSVNLTLLSKKELSLDLNASKNIIQNIGNATIIIFDKIAMMTIAETNRGKYSSGEYTAVLTQISEIVQSNLDTYSAILEMKL